MLYEHQTQPLLEKLRAGDIDLGILALPVPLDGLEARALYDESFTLAVPNNSPLAKRSIIKSTTSTAKRCCCWKTYCLRDQALDVCSRIDVERGLSRHEPGDPAADGRGGARHHGAPQLATRGPFGSGQGAHGRHSRGRSPRAASAQCGARARRARTQSRLCATWSTPRWFPERRWPSRAFPASATCTTTRSLLRSGARHAADGVLRRAGVPRVVAAREARVRRNPRGGACSSCRGSWDRASARLPAATIRCCGCIRRRSRTAS